MRLSIPVLLRPLALCLLTSLTVPAQPARSLEPPRAAARRNPFEAIPAEATAPGPTGPVIRALEFRGAQRMLQPALRAAVWSRAGGPYDVEALERDARALRNTQRFSHVAWQAELTPEGPIVRFSLIERPLIASIEYAGDDAVSPDEVAARLASRKLNLRVETLLDEGELTQAALAIQELLEERGRRGVTITPVVERLGPPPIAKITFKAGQP